MSYNADSRIFEEDNDKNVEQIPVNLGKKSLRQRLEAYYSLIAPDAIADEVEWKRKFELIYKKYGGTVKGERALVTKLCKKYGDIVRLRLDCDTTANKEVAAAALSLDKKENVTKKDESWYDLSPRQLDSGVVDFTCEKFDPAAALFFPSSKVYEINPFIQKSPLLDNISRFTAHLPECDPLKQKNNQNRPKRKQIDQDATNENTASTKKRKIPFLTSIVESYENAGPFSLLYNIHVKRQRIRVMIRYTDCIRSTLTGYLLAFDKHMNMILRDVDEVYTPCVTKLYKNMGFSKGELEMKRRTCIVGGDENVYSRNQKERTRGNNSHESKLKESASSINPSPSVKVKQRHCRQLFVRGDNVVMVWRAGAERSAWPKTTISPARSIYENSLSHNREGHGEKMLSSKVTNCNMAGTPGSLLLTLQAQNNKNIVQRK